MLVSSVDIAKCFNRQHKCVLKVLRRFIERKSICFFTEELYISDRNRKYCCIMLDKKAYLFLDNYYNNIRSKSTSSSLLYLIKDDRYVKIGITRSEFFARRLMTIQNGNPTKLEVLLKVKTSNALQIETFLHNKYKEHNILNEWFDVKDKIENIKKDIYELL